MTGHRMVAVDELAARITGRTRSLLQDDMHRQEPALQAAVRGRRVLVVGGAGSIGSASVRELLRLQPQHLAVVDHDENGLVELVRDLRSGDCVMGTELHALPLDFGSGVMRQFLASQAPFDLVMNFAANKHVRGEKDRFSLLQMLDTNLCKAARLVETLAATGFKGRHFCVSTDKAANPANLMGASKRLMELLVFRDGALPGASMTSARFANVAFSAGSLLWGFLRRLEKGQPLAVPRATQRYFLTPVESGQLCVLAAAAAPGGHLVVPRLDETRDLRRLEDTAAMVVEAHGYRPRFHDDEAALRRAFAADVAAGSWPILRTELDTTGEKPCEQFVADGERTVDIGMRALQGIAMAPGPAGDVVAFVRSLDDNLRASRAAPGVHDLVAAIEALLPEFAHRTSALHLDQRM